MIDFDHCLSYIISLDLMCILSTHVIHDNVLCVISPRIICDYFLCACLACLDIPPFTTLAQDTDCSVSLSISEFLVLSTWSLINASINWPTVLICFLPMMISLNMENKVPCWGFVYIFYHMLCVTILYTYF